MKREKRVLIAGYFGYGNVGDELILEAMLEEFSRLPIKVSFLSKEKKYLFFEPGKKVRVFSRYSFRDVFIAVICCDTLILGGGCLFQDKTGLLTPLYYFSLCLLAKILLKKVRLVSNSFGPLSSPLARRLLTLAIRLSDSVTLRDRISEKYIKHPDRKKINQTADLLYVRAGQNAGLIAVKTEYRPVAAIIPNYHMTDKTLSVLKSFMDRRKINRRYIIFFEKDVEITGKMNISNGLLRPRPCFEEVRRSFEGFGCVISFRLHGAIMADLLGLPYILIGDDEKFEGMALPELFIRERELEYDLLSEAYSNIQENYDGIRQNMLDHLEKKHSLAKKNFSEII